VTTGCSGVRIPQREFDPNGFLQTGKSQSFNSGDAFARINRVHHLKQTGETTMAFDAFLIFETGGGVAAHAAPGETQDQAYKKDKAIEISSFSFGADNSLSVGSKSSGAGAGKASFKLFKFRKNIDSASTGLFQTLCEGGHFESVRLELRKAGAASGKLGDPYAKVRMKMAFVTEIEYSGSDGDDVPSEEVSLAVGSILIQYRAQDAKGALGPVAEAKWSQVINKATDEVA
jgi:type VI secretion system secreted protein Hcp